MPDVIQTASQFGDAVDTYYTYVRGRVKGYNTSRGFGGIVSAESWPPKDVQPAAFYLTVLTATPTTKGTIGNPEYRHSLQWTWVTQGTDIAATTVGANRGDRYRIDQTMRDELLRANFPQFSPLVSLSFDQTSGAVTATPYSPQRKCRWTQLSFGPRPSLTDEAGTLFGAAAVDVYAFMRSMSQ